MVEVSKLVPREKRGLVVVITAMAREDDHGFGIAVRACGHHMRVKHYSIYERYLYSESGMCEKMGGQIELIPTGKGFCGIKGIHTLEEHRKNAQMQSGWPPEMDSVNTIFSSWMRSIMPAPAARGPGTGPGTYSL